jgi:hypothetical protein
MTRTDQNVHPRIAAGAVFALALFAAPAHAASADVAQIKTSILAMATSFSGQGDPDFSRQKALEPLVQQLLAANPQAPLSARLPLLYGAWKQVWGPYNYKSKKRDVDPEIGVDEIYQVVFAGGYYYNVTPLYKNGNRAAERIGLLRGEFKPDPQHPNSLLVHFTNFPGLSARPQSGPPLPALPALVETGKLVADTAIVPSWIVRWFFGSGALNEVYTDADLRILYGTGSDQLDRPALYVMTRVGVAVP